MGIIPVRNGRQTFRVGNAIAIRIDFHAFFFKFSARNLYFDISISIKAYNAAMVGVGLATFGLALGVGSP